MWFWVRAMRGTSVRFGKLKWNGGHPVISGAVGHSDKQMLRCLVSLSQPSLSSSWSRSASVSANQQQSQAHCQCLATGRGEFQRGSWFQGHMFPRPLQELLLVISCWYPGAHSSPYFPTSADLSTLTRWRWFVTLYSPVPTSRFLLSCIHHL